MKLTNDLGAIMEEKLVIQILLFVKYKNGIPILRYMLLDTHWGTGVLLKYLGENSHYTAIKKAVAVAVPFDLGSSAKQVEHGWSQVYQYWLLRQMKNTVRKKAHLLADQVNIHELLAARTFHTFDNLGTAPVHGFRDADDYYLRASCRSFLRNITTPVLIIQAIDDPLVCPLSIPAQDELGVGVTLELSRYGGHLGFVGKGCSGLSKH